MDLYLIPTLVFIVGAAVGSFVNVVALRYNTGLSFVKGDSRCLNCNRKIDSSNLVPIFSYVNLSGRCVHCKSKLPVRYLLVEIFSGLLALLLFAKFQAVTFETFLLFFLFELLILIFLYDAKHKIIPDQFVYLFIILSFLYNHSLPGLVFVPLPFFLIWLISKGRLLGFGDIKLMAGMGALLGFKVGLEAVFISFWIGAAYVIILKVAGKKLKMKSEIPFAPFLVLGTVIEFFFQFKLF